MEKTYELKKAAELLHYNAEVLRRKLKAGDIPASKVGKKWIIKESTIEELLK